MNNNTMIPTTEWLGNPEIFAVNRIKPHSDHKYTVNDGKEEVSLKQSLNGVWKFTFSENPLKREKDFYKTTFDTSVLDDIKVPGHMSLQGYGQVQYTNSIYPWDGVMEGAAPAISEDRNETGGYVRDVVIDKKLLGKRLFISFQGVATAFYLYINDNFVGYAEDSFTPSEFEITGYVTEGVNRIGVEVWQRSTGDWLEDQDFWRLYGIFREVYIYAIPETHVRDIFVRTDIEDDLATASLSINAEIINPSGGSADVVLFDADGRIAAEKRNIVLTENFTMELDVENPKLWSAEVPYLYDLKMILHSGDVCIETAAVKTGFRKFEMKDGIMCINGKRIEFRGVNRHEFSHKGGRCVTEEEMLWDIMFMKQHNINAVRTCHYPDATRWYELCDEYGIYLIDETNLETHGTWCCGNDKDEIIPGSKPEWLEIVLDRASSMFHRDKNHPSVLIWSCGNESHCGENIYKMSEFFRKNDSSRLVHYEGVWADRKYDGATDMETRMYAKPWDIEKYLNNNPAKPFISCEYSHAMGNSNGGLNEYTALYDKYPMYQGGFIWDYIDQSLEKDDGYGGRMLAYGGDFGDRPNDNDFCVNGLIFGDRRTTPKMQELKYLYQPISLNVSADGIRIKNRNLFTGTDDYLLEVWMLIDGVRYGQTVMTVDVPALCEKFVKVNMEVPKIYGEQIMQASLVLAKDLPWAKKGHEVAFGETIIVNGFDMERKGAGEYDGCASEVPLKIRMARGAGYTGVYCDNVPGDGGRDMSVSYMFDKGRGLVSVKKNGRELLAKEVKPCFYRASTDNDRGNGYMFDSGVWQYAEKWLRVAEYDAKMQDGRAEIIYKYELPLCAGAEIIVKGKGLKEDNGRKGIIVEVAYSVAADGSCKVSAKYPGAADVPELPLFGVRVVFDKSFDKYSYYGKGPMENYSDRNSGAGFGIFEGGVADNLTEYIIPGECGNRTGVRRLSIYSGEDGLEFTALNKPMECSMLHYNDAQLEEAYHVCELPRPTYTFVKLMAGKLGVGGDDSWGAQTHEQYRIPGDRPMEIDFVINVSRN